MAQAGLAECDQGRIDRLVRAAFGAERDAARRRDEQEARILITGVVEAIEAAGDERVVKRSDREKARSEQVAGEAGRREHQEEIALGDAELDMLPIVVAAPFLCRGNLCLGEDVGHLAAPEQAALVHPGAEVGRNGDVGRGRDDPVGEVAARTWTGRAGFGRTRPGSTALPQRALELPGFLSSRSCGRACRGRRGCDRSAPRRPAGHCRRRLRAAPTHDPRVRPSLRGARSFESDSSGPRDCPCGRQTAGRSP